MRTVAIHYEMDRITCISDNQPRLSHWWQRTPGFCFSLIQTTVSTNIVHYLLHENIDLVLLNKLHGPMHNNLCVTCLYNAHVFYTTISRQCNELPGQYSHTIQTHNVIYSMRTLIRRSWIYYTVCWSLK